MTLPVGNREPVNSKIHWRAPAARRSHARSVFIDRHRVRDAGVDLRPATHNFRIPGVCSAGLGFPSRRGSIRGQVGTLL